MCPWSTSPLLRTRYAIQARPHRGGRLHDRGWSVRGTGAALLLAPAAVVLAGFGGRSIVVVLIAVLLLDVGTQGSNVPGRPG
ncbi:hypothetical protein ABZ401_20970 [Streptomyces sp. NPDC005892]|uniref:hypothetical protein n=1 Tax=Streptomyces sp. NPDC005892 TaxID=3155593 RepID=UPI0033E6B4DB